MKTKRLIKKYLVGVKNLFGSVQKVVALIAIILISTILFIVILHLWVSNMYSKKRYTNVEDVPQEKVAIVFGAGLKDKQPGNVLRDRVAVAVDLYKAGKVQKIIMSGENSSIYYDEPGAMIKMAKDEGVPETALQPDYAGRRTYDTCLRARKIFKLDSAILITQSYHMDRALYTCNSLGVRSVGVTSDLHEYKGQNWYAVRDYFALVKAVWELNVSKPNNVIMGDTINL